MNIPKKSRNYINNATLYTHLLKYLNERKAAEENNLPIPQIPDYIAICICKIIDNLSTKKNFSGYSYIDEMRSDARENCFHGSTKVLTIEHGPIELNKIIDETVTVKCKDGIWRPATCKSYGKQMLYKIGIGSRNKSLDRLFQHVIVTKNHRWFVKCRLNKRHMFEYKDEIIEDLRIGDMLESAENLDHPTADSVIHGLIFGDGTGHKDFVYSNSRISIQGNKYAFMRVCKQDHHKDEIIKLLNDAGYKCTYPPSGNGDPVYRMGKLLYVKDVPFTNDPSYISGFIYGWWLADGVKKTKQGHIVISTVDEKAIQWLQDYSGYAGLSIMNIRKTLPGGKGRYETKKYLYTVSMGSKEYYNPRIKSIEEYGIDEVYCLEEPITNSFVLANGLLTGNCFRYLDRFNPEKYNKPFQYFTQISWYAFIRRIQEEKKQHYIKVKNLQKYNLEFEDDIHSEITDNFIRDYELSLTKKKKPVKIKGLEKFYETKSKLDE